MRPLQCPAVYVPSYLLISRFDPPVDLFCLAATVGLAKKPRVREQNVPRQRSFASAAVFSGSDRLRPELCCKTDFVLPGLDDGQIGLRLGNDRRRRLQRIFPDSQRLAEITFRF